MSEPEANERGNSLIGKKSHYRGIESLFAKRKELWLCANETFTMRNALARNFGYARKKTFRMRNGLAMNFGYVRMEDLGCAADSQGIVAMLEWEI